MDEEKALVKREGSHLAVTPAEVVRQATEQAKLLMDIVESRELYQEIEGKKYLEVEAWQTIGAFNQIHAVTDWILPIYTNPVNSTDIIGYEAQVTLMKGGDKVGSAIMTCGLDEFPCRGKEGQTKHKAARSAAQTWAESKAYRMNFAYIAVLAGYQPTPAEEMITENKTLEHWCPIHKEAFRKMQKGKSTWWSHKTVDGQWCNEAKLSEIVKTLEQEGVEVETVTPIPNAEPVALPETIEAEGLIEVAPETIQDLLQWAYKKGKKYTPSWVCKVLQVKAPNEITDIQEAYQTLKELQGW